MQIHTWSSDHVPASRRWIARIFLFDNYLPVIIQSSTEQGAIERATEFYESEKARIAKQQARTRPTPPKTRYWYHPESDSLYTTGPEGTEDPLSVELDKADYESRQQAANTPTDDTDLEDMFT